MYKTDDDHFGDRQLGLLFANFKANRLFVLSACVSVVIFKQSLNKTTEEINCEFN